MRNNTSTPQSSTPQGPDSVISEIYERRSRENNIILYGLPEAAPATANDETMDHDRSFAGDLLWVCGVSDGQKIYKTVRLGRRADKPRPLLLKISDLNTKPELLKNIRNLKGNAVYRQVRVAKDLTRNEREMEANLRREAKNLETAERGRHKVVGPHGTGK